MNEMNNLGNEFNNQNNEFHQNQGMNNLPNQQYVQQEQLVTELPKKNNNVLIIILLLLVIGLAGFILYDKMIKKEEPVKQVENNSENTNNSGNSSGTNNNTSNTEVKVEELMFKTLKDSSVMQIRLPRITGNTEAIIKLNNAIQKDLVSWYVSEVEYIMEIIGKNVEDKHGYFETRKALAEEIDAELSCFGETSVDYEAYQKNNVIAINVFKLTCQRASSWPDNTADFYFYDIANDKVIDYVEAAERFGAKISNDVIDENGKQIEPCKTYKDLKPTNANGIKYGVYINMDSNNNMKVECFYY